MELQGPRVTIRPWRRADDDLANEWPPYNDPLDPLWNLPRQFSIGETWGSFFDMGSGRQTWAVEDAAGQLLGRISLREKDPRKNQARLGITFGAPFVGRGLGTEALATFLDYYFTTLGYEAMVLDVAAPNVRAVRCYQRLGFSYVGSDWREAGSTFDPHVVEMPSYRGLARYFRPSGRGLAVEFFEMRLSREEWAARRRELALALR